MNSHSKAIPATGIAAATALVLPSRLVHPLRRRRIWSARAARTTRQCTPNGPVSVSGTSHDPVAVAASKQT